MEKFRRLALFGLFGLTSCSSSFLKFDKPEQLQKNSEFEQQVQIKAATEASSPKDADKIEQDENIKSMIESSSHASKPVVAETKSKSKKKKELEPKKGTAKKTDEVKVLRHEPADVEDQAGFEGRRPIKNPFRVGEEVIHSVNYFKMSAGTLTMKVDPFVEVNGRKSYSMVTSIKTSGVFSSFYSADDKSIVFMDYELLIPRVFSLHVKESGQLREGRSFFDFDKLRASYWEKKVTKKNGVEEKKQDWDILPYSQNVFSAAFYMRVFQWEVGKEYAFRVADDNENLIFRGKALRKEKISTDAGEFNAIVIQPQIEAKGVFKPTGDNYFWLSDDDRKYILRIESSIKIGTLVSEAVKINPGNPE